MPASPAPTVPTDPPPRPLPPKKRAALYLRVSKRDGGQTEENQRRQAPPLSGPGGVRPRAPRRHPPGVRRPGVRAEGPARALGVLGRLRGRRAAGVRHPRVLEPGPVQPRGHPEDGRLLPAARGARRPVPVYTEPYLSTENELVSHVLLGVLSYFAEYEAQKISRRTIAGLERARAEGKRIGRPSTFDEHRKDLEQMLDAGVAKAEMARRTGLAYNTVKQHLRRIDAERSASYWSLPYSTVPLVVRPPFETTNASETSQQSGQSDRFSNGRL